MTLLLVGLILIVFAVVTGPEWFYPVGLVLVVVGLLRLLWAGLH